MTILVSALVFPWLGLRQWPPPDSRKQFPLDLGYAPTHHSEPPSRGGALFCPLLAAAEAKVEGAIVWCGGE